MVEHVTVQLGELVAAAFDEAQSFSDDPLVVSQLAVGAVLGMLCRAPLIRHARGLPRTMGARSASGSGRPPAN